MRIGAGIVLALVIGLQGLDIAVHAATGGIEPIRAVSNAIIGAGAIASVLAPARSPVVIGVSVLIYLALNLTFVAEHGLINPATEAPRLPLIAFVVGSLALIAWLGRKLRRVGADS